MMNKPMATRGFCCVFKGGGLWWLNGCNHLPYVFSLMLCMVLFLPCGGKDKISGVHNPLLYTGCENFRDFDGTVETESNLPRQVELEKLCFQSNSLCFPSTLIGLEINFDGLHSEKNNVDVNNFGSCKRSPSPNPNPVAFSSKSSPSSHVDINPPLLDWGANSLFTPSCIHLTVGNTHNSSVMHVFELFSSDGQFYASGFEKLSLAPGEAGSIVLVFLPRRLGLSSAHVVLQTSFGSFVIPAQGLAVHSPYELHPSPSFDLLLDGRLSWSLSLHNTLNEVLYVEEINARISVYSEDASYTDLFICRIEQSQNSFGQFGSFCKIGKAQVPWMEVRPKKHWEVLPSNTEVIMEINLYPPFKGNISGVICVKLQNCTRDKFETIIIPLEAEVDSKAIYNSLTGSVSVFLDTLVPWDGRDLVCTVSLINRAPYLLSVVSIAENLKDFKVKYMEGLLLYPGTTTQVALISYTHPDLLEHIPPKNLWVSDNCMLSLLTNDSISPQIDITCEDLVQAGCRKGDRSGFIEPESSFIGLKSQELKLTNARTGALESLIEESRPRKLKIQELLEADRLILWNWRSQGTMSNLFVIKDHELSFPVIQIGSQFSKWITVHNPSQKPLLMQLVLNPGAIIAHCKFPDDSFNGSGFSLASGESMKLLLSYQPDFSAELVQRSLKLTMDTGFLVIPMEANLPVHLVDMCKKSLVRTVIWKLLALFFFAVLAICLLLFAPMHTQKVKVKGADHQKKSTLPSPPPANIPCETLDNFEASESPECVNLTVKVVNERRRRRRKKRPGGGGLASKSEVSSSQSGNSMPSSPMSPTVFTPNYSFSAFSTVSKEQNHEKKLDFGFTMAAKVPEPPRNTKRPIAPYARAPGSKLSKENGMKAEDASFDKEYTYDIWGNHFCVHLTGKVNELPSKVCNASEGDSQSFFIRDPQSLMMMSSAQSECSGRKLTTSDVDYLHEIK